ncbi:hypothetical protein K3495_g15037 [Podosphaera aphanis]|nr:hypothetical protein K3495_g15037 [Podosphaera aphanis]
MPKPPAQATPAHSTVLDIRNPRPSSNPRSCSSNADARVIARLPTSHPFRGEDTLLVRTKLRQLLDRPELIKDVRIVPTGLALVAPSRNLVPDLLLAAEKLQPLLGNVPLERQEKRINFLLGPVPKYGYNAHGAREDLTFDEIRQELADAKVDPKSIFAMSWTHRSRDSPHSDGTLRLVISERATQNLPSNIRLFARSVRLRPTDDRPQMQVLIFRLMLTAQHVPGASMVRLLVQIGQDYNPSDVKVTNPGQSGTHHSHPHQSKYNQLVQPFQPLLSLVLVLFQALVLPQPFRLELAPPPEITRINFNGSRPWIH